MKHTLLILATLLCCSFGTSEKTTTTQANGTVYICTGPQSKRYHCDRYCQGLSSCSKSVIAVSIDKARKMGRTPCKWCY